MRSRRQTGAALVVALIMMLVLTVLGVSAMNMATLELTMASNSQSAQQAFQAAETGINLGLASRNFTTTGPTSVPDASLGNGAVAKNVSVTFQATTPVPDIAFSMGPGTGNIVAFHFDANATGVGPRGAQAQHTQSFYVIGPGGP